MLGLLFGMTAIGGSVAVLAYLVLGRARQTALADQLAADGTLIVAPDTGRSRAAAEAHGPSLVRRALVALAAKLSGRNYARTMQERLDRAGNPRKWDVQRLLAAKGAGLLVGVVLGLIIGTKQGGIFTLAAPAAVGALGFVLPTMYVRNLGDHRQDDLLRGLPDAIDMMTVCVEAGLGFDAALARVARNLEGPFPEECARMLQEMQIGKSRAQALRALLDRTEVTELRAFVTAVVQSSELGISIGDVLREQSHQMRVNRRHRAEEKAQKLQVKLLFPLITCLLPSMFIVILGPAAMQIIHFFGSANH